MGNNISIHHKYNIMSYYIRKKIQAMSKRSSKDFPIVREN